MAVDLVRPFSGRDKAKKGPLVTRNHAPASVSVVTIASERRLGYENCHKIKAHINNTKQKTNNQNTYNTTCPHLTDVSFFYLKKKQNKNLNPIKKTKKKQQKNKKKKKLKRMS